MPANVDNRLLERFRMLQRLNSQPAVPQAEKRVGAAAPVSSRPPAIDLRD